MIEHVPADQNQQQRQHVPHGLWNFGKLLFEQPLNTQQHEKIQSHSTKFPARAVPEARERPDDEEVQVDMLAVAAERYVDIIPEERAERNVPPSPEFGNGLCGIRQLEVLHVPEPEDPAKADRHVGIAREVEVDLEHVHERAKPDAKRRRPGKRAPSSWSATCPMVGKQNLLPRPTQNRVTPRNTFSGSVSRDSICAATST